MIRAAGRTWSGASVRIPHSGSILAELDGAADRASGGTWVRISGEVVRDAFCRSDADHVVWASDPRLRARVAEFSEALLQARERAETQLGGRTGRLAVQLGGALTTIDGPVIHLGSAEVEIAVRSGDFEHLANQVVAMRRVWDASPSARDWRDVIAVARALGSDRADAWVALD